MKIIKFASTAIICACLCVLIGSGCAEAKTKCEKCPKGEACVCKAEGKKPCTPGDKACEAKCAAEAAAKCTKCPEGECKCEAKPACTKCPEGECKCEAPAATVATPPAPVTE